MLRSWDIGTKPTLETLEPKVRGTVLNTKPLNQGVSVPNLKSWHPSQVRAYIFYLWIFGTDWQTRQPISENPEADDVYRVCIANTIPLDPEPWNLMTGVPLHTLQKPPVMLNTTDMRF